MFDVAKFERKLQNYHNNKCVGRKDCKDYLTSLARLTRHISKDAKSYASLATITKKWISGYKAIFGKPIFKQYNSIKTEICFKLLKCFYQFEPNYSYQFYCEWGHFIHSSPSSKRAETFITHIREFEFVVKHLQATENRWDQFIILGILRIYTKKVKFDDIKGLNWEGCDAFLDIIQKIIPLQHHKQASIRMNNAFLNDLNSKSGNILSFQPYKIVFDNSIYIVTDYDLWIDFNIKTKTISFVALSVVDDVYGVTSTNEMKIVSNTDHTISIKNDWNLNTTNEFICSDDEVEIVFCFSSRVHNSILESKLKTVFEVIQLKTHVLSKTSFLKTVLGVNTSRMADESMLSSHNEMHLVGELEKLQIPAQSNGQITPSSLNEENIGFQTVNNSSKSDVNEENIGFNDGGRIADMIQTVNNSSKSDVHQTASIILNGNEAGLAIEDSKTDTKKPLVTFETASINLNGNEAGLVIEDTKTDTKKPLVTYKKLSTQRRVVKKRFLKRRRDQGKQRDCSSTDNESNEPGAGASFRKFKRACKRLTNLKVEKEQLRKQTANHEPSLIVKEGGLLSSIPNLVIESAISRTVTMNEPKFEMQAPVKRSPSDKKHIKVLSDEILVVADDVKHELANISSTSNKNDQQLDGVQCLPQVSNQLVNANVFIVPQMEEDKKNIQMNHEMLPPNQHSVSIKRYFNYNFYRQSWPIRKFVWSLRMEEQDEVEENVQPIDDDVKTTDVYDSVSVQRH